MARHTAEVRAGNLSAATLRFYDTMLARINATLGPNALLAEITEPRVDDYIVRRRADGVYDHTVFKEP